LKSTGNEQRQELRAIRKALHRAHDDNNRKKHAISSLQRHQHELTEQASLVVQQQTEELTRLRKIAQEGQALREEVMVLQEEVERLEVELEGKESKEEECASLLVMVEEQQRMIGEMERRERVWKEEGLRAGGREAEWRGRGKMWARERAGLEKEVRELRFQLQKALAR